MGQILLADSIEVLQNTADETYDLIVTDPPYNSKEFDWDKKEDEWQITWLEQAKRVLKDGGSFYCFFAPMNMYMVEGWIRQNLHLKNVIVWWHKNLYGAGLSFGTDRWKSTWDVIFYAVKGKTAKHEINVQKLAFQKFGHSFDVFDYPQPRPVLHPAQKPIELIEKIIVCSSNEGDLILDPFVGVGTVPLAAENLNRDYVGIEIDPTFVEIAELRLKNRHRLREVDESIKRSYVKIDKLVKKYKVELDEIRVPKKLI